MRPFSPTFHLTDSDCYLNYSSFKICSFLQIEWLPNKFIQPLLHHILDINHSSRIPIHSLFHNNIQANLFLKSDPRSLHRPMKQFTPILLFDIFNHRPVSMIQLRVTLLNLNELPITWIIGEESAEWT